MTEWRHPLQRREPPHRHQYPLHHRRPRHLRRNPLPLQERPPPPPAPPAAPSAMGGGDEKPSTQYVPPSGVRGGTPLGGEKNEETKKHDEARRFARLLVSEIKLYNESKVDAGRKN